MVCPYKVKFRKYERTMKGRAEILDVKNLVPIRDGDFVEGPVVPTGAPIPGRLLGQYLEG